MRTRKPPNPGSRLGMPLTAWPESDQAAWGQAFVPVSGFQFRAPPGTRLRATSKIAIMNGYARWLAWLLPRAPEERTTPLEARVTEARVLAYLNDLDEQITPETMSNYGRRLWRALELMCPATDWQWFAPIVLELQARARSVRRVKRNFVPSHLLFDHGLELMKAAEESADLTDRARAEAYRNGLMIAFLALRPLRLRNMTELEIGTQLVETAQGYEVTILPDRSKTKMTLEFPVPDDLTPPLKHYLERYRPTLAAGSIGAEERAASEPAYLWLARSGAQFPADTFSDMVTKRTFERFGQRLTPHEFRHCAATSIAEFNPEDFHIIKVILGHANLTMAQQYYIRAKGRETMRSYQAVLARKRKQLRQTGGSACR